jgi:pimeloyl-ACP methyl ester carboxylesterase
MKNHPISFTPTHQKTAIGFSLAAKFFFGILAFLVPLSAAEPVRIGLLEDSITYAEMSAPKVSQWNGYERIDFAINGRAVLLVKPKAVTKGNPWIWRMEFFGHEPQADLGLLEKGFHVAYIDMQDLYGCPQAMEIMDGCFLTLRDGWQLSGKVVLEGFSRGGLYAFNWAAHRPRNVAALYVDAPVCDFKSWPGGKGAGPGSAPDWERCLKVYGLSEAEAMAYPRNPVDHLEPIAKAGIPILAVIGDADEVVPVSENIDLVEKRYRALGGSIKVIRKPGVKHHPHSLKDPKPIVDFLLRAVGR